MGSKTKQIKDSDGQDKSSREAMGMEARQNEGEDKRKHEEDKEKKAGEKTKRKPAMRSLIDARLKSFAARASNCSLRARLRSFVTRKPQPPLVEKRPRENVLMTVAPPFKGELR